jgi:acyl dehydratase
VRLRALPPLLAVVAADYALWDWSIASGHDVVSLVAGLTLLPMAAIALGMLAVATARFLRFLLAGATSRTSTVRASAETEPAGGTHRKVASEEGSSGRLAA